MCDVLVEITESGLLTVEDTAEIASCEACTIYPFASFLYMGSR